MYIEENYTECGHSTVAYSETFNEVSLSVQLYILKVLDILLNFLLHFSFLSSTTSITDNGLENVNLYPGVADSNLLLTYLLHGADSFLRS